MNGFACLSNIERRDLLTEAAVRRHFSPVMVEKDFWVCWTLLQLFALPGNLDHIVFKGGTSLSKIYNAIERFSEDIDLSIDETILGTGPAIAGELSKNQRQKRFDRIWMASEEYVAVTIMPALHQQFDPVRNPTGKRGRPLGLDEAIAPTMYEEM